MKASKATATRAFPLTAACNWAFNRLNNRARSAALFGLAGLLAFFSGCQHAPPASTVAAPSPSCQRIVSYSPSITEIVYALGLENNLVGVTRFCKFPPQAQQKPSVGGYLDPNIEAAIRLRPTLVLLREEQSDIKGRLANFQRPTLTVEHRSVVGILQSFLQIGKACHREEPAQRLVSALNAEIDRIRQKTKQAKTHPRVLVVVDRDVRYNTVKQVYVAANDGFYDWIITQAGGQNAMPGKGAGFSELSAEGILRINPEVIIEIMPGMANSTLGQSAIQRAWMTMPGLTAVKTHRLYLFTDDYMSIPGPRFVKTLGRFAQTLHPELGWSKNG